MSTRAKPAHSPAPTPRRPELEALLNCCVAAARAAALHALSNSARRRQATRRFAHDVKLALDLESQRAAEAVIRRANPSHSILGEEQSSGRGNNPWRWVIDPIDGTVNFLHGSPWWCSSVAVQHEGRTVAGAVFGPEYDELFTAHSAGPALCNGRLIRVSDTHAMGSALICTGIVKQGAERKRSFLTFRRITEACQKTRIQGSAALDICSVACGRADAFFESGIYLWDVAAAGLIVERAGGRADYLKNGPGNRVHFLASNGIIHAALRRVLGRCGA